MNKAIERLLTLRISDVMSKNVVSLSSRTTMAAAARKLLDYAISGAPVVDERRHCTGVLSAIDFVKQQGGVSMADRERHEDLVCHHMTSAVKTIAADQTLLSAARMMCAEHIHRLPVVDEQGRLGGMITSLDIVATLINVIDEYD
jgi:CBS-domain-containing membrane protein